MTVSGYVLTDQMLMWMGSPQEVFGLSSTYLKIYFLGGFSLVLYNMLVGIIRAGGDAKHPLYYLIVSSILNVILDVVFITVFKMGLPVLPGQQSFLNLRVCFCVLCNWQEKKVFCIFHGYT